MNEARLIDGKAIAAEIRQEIAANVAAMTAAGHPRPGLGVILVGDHPASASYVRAKTKACAEVGFHSVQVNRSDTIDEEELLAEVARMNADPAIHGILVQLPLPVHINAQRVLEAVDPRKDVDGFHPVSAGRLAVGLPAFVPCTPRGVIELLVRSGVETSGRVAAVIGRSNIVGKPVAQLLARKGPGGDATVIVCHSRTPDVGAITRQADIVVAAIGQAGFLRGDMIKPGATVIDVGVNRVDDAGRERGYRLVGDVDFEEARRVAGAITPVPGGVGPMTIAMLLRNTYRGASVAAGLPDPGE